MTSLFKSKEDTKGDKVSSGPVKEKTPLTKSGKPFTDRDSGWKKVLKK